MADDSLHETPARWRPRRQPDSTTTSGEAQARTRVAHISSHHRAIDGRIFYRECATLSAAGYEVLFVVPHAVDEYVDDIRVLAIPRARNRLERFTITAYRAIRRAWQENPAIYHLHDPELLFGGMILRLLGKKVIFDAHEDFAQASGVREWIPDFGRKPIALFYSAVAALAGRLMHIVIAERYYRRTFPDATEVLNYPDLTRMQPLLAIQRAPPSAAATRLIYVGSVTGSRGALHHARLARHIPGAEVHMIGYCQGDVADAIVRRCPDLRIIAVDGDGTRRILRDGADSGEQPPSTVVLEGIDRYISGAEILARLSEDWTAALAIFPYSEHYFEKELTKFFEYMVAALPTIASDFPVWRALLEDCGAGICVDPTDLDEAARQVIELQDDPGAFLRMGQSGRAAVRDRYNWSSESVKLAALYEEVLRP